MQTSTANPFFLLDKIGEDIGEVLPRRIVKIETFQTPVENLCVSIIMCMVWPCTETLSEAMELFGSSSGM